MKVHELLMLVLAFGFLAGCGETETPPAEGSKSDTSKTSYLATDEPSNATPVGMAREQVEDGETVTLLGHIGGSTEPFVKGLAAFTIVDPKVPYCQPEEGCPTPWDYCCTQDQVKLNIATVKVVDGAGTPVKQDARELLGVKELSLVVVEGTAQRDAQGNLAVLARQVFIRQ